jgi:hypothetical protein
VVIELVLASDILETEKWMQRFCSSCVEYNSVIIMGRVVAVAVRIFYFQLEVRNEASCPVFIAYIAIGYMLIAFLTRMSLFSDTCDSSSLAAKTKTP